MSGNPDSPLQIGKRLRQLRQMAGLSRDKLAELAQVGKSSISYWEHAKANQPLKQRSMSKIIEAIRSCGVECNDRWLIFGTGPTPRLTNNNSTIKNIDRIDLSSQLSLSELTPQLISILDQEIKLFCSISPLSIIIKIDNRSMSPAIEPGDFVGGIWQPSSNLATDKICIVDIERRIQVRQVRHGSQPGLFHLTYLHHDPLQPEPFEIKDISLEKLAPVIRLWR